MGHVRKPAGMTKKHLSKAQRVALEVAESQLKAGTEGLQNPPSYLDCIARAEYLRVVEAAEGLGIIDTLDKAILETYAASYSQFVEAEAKITEGGRVLKDGSVSPYVQLSEKAIKQIHQCSIRLGLAATDRLKLRPSTDAKKENKFLRFLA